MKALTYHGRGRRSSQDVAMPELGIAEMLEAYDVFARAEGSGALKVALFRA
jgi:hypothetical protein